MRKILIVNNAEKRMLKFAWDIANIIDSTSCISQIIQYNQLGELNFSDFTGVIMSGSPRGDDIVTHHLPYFQWIKDYNKPVLGIFAGHHIVGVLYGSELLRSKEPESGDFYVEVTKDDPIFTGMPKSIKVKQMHYDLITLPEDFEVLATASICRNQLMKHKEKPIYTCQFHPEYYNHDLIKNFIEQVVLNN